MVGFGKSPAIRSGLIVCSLFLAGVAFAQSYTTPVIRTTQQDWVNAVAFSPDGTRLAIGILGQTQTVSCPGGQALGSGNKHTKYVQGLAFAPDGTSFYSIGWDGLLCRWRIGLAGTMDSRPELTKALRTSRPQCLLLATGGTQVVTNGDGDSLDVYDAESLLLKITLSGMDSAPTNAVVDPGRNRLYAGDKNGDLAAWNLVGGELLKKWGGHGGRVAGLAIDATNGELVSCDDRGELKKWDPERFRETDKREFGEATRGLQISRDGSFVYLALKSGEILLLDRELQRVAAPLKVNGRPNSLALDDRGRYLACGTDGNQLLVWDLLQIREVKIAYDTPARLQLEVDYEDSGALIPNRALDGGEEVELGCVVKNVGAGTAYDATLHVSCDNPDITFPATIPLGDLIGGSTKPVPVPLTVALEARDGRANFDLHVSEKKLNDARAALGIAVRYLPKPDLEVTLIQLDDQDAGSTSGNNNRIPENGETVEVEFFVKNNGAGPAWENRLELTGRTPGVTVLIGELDLPPIPAGGRTSGRVRLQIPKTFAGDALFAEAEIRDDVTGRSVKASETWTAGQNKPLLAADWRVIQAPRNGRPARLQLRLLNRGTMDAENLAIAIEDDQGLPLRQSVSRVPRIVAGGEDPGVTVDLEIPREFQSERITLSARVEQANFPASSFSQVFDVALSRPDLVVKGFDEDIELVQGGELNLDLYVQNNGDLDAEDVRVTVVSRALELNRSQQLHAIPSGGRIETLDKISWPVKSGRPAGPVDLTIQVTQRHFDPVEIALRPTVVEARIARQDIRSTEVSTGLMAPGGGSVAASAAGGGNRQGIEIETFGLPEIVRDPNQEFKLVVNAPLGVDAVEGYVNGQLIYSLADRSDQQAVLRSTGNQFLQTDIRLRNLHPGENRLEFSVVDASRDTRKLTLTLNHQPLDFNVSAELDLGIDVNTPPRTRLRNPDGVALLIGISRYQNRGCDIPPVEYARQDVLAVKETLIHTLGYSEENIIVLLDNEAGKNTILDVLEYELRELVQPGRSDVFVYYSGHGAPDAEWNGYLVPYDANPAPIRIQRTALAVDDFYQMLSEIPARRMIVALDACFSGRAEGKDIVDKVSPIRPVVRTRIGDQENRVVFSASDGKEMSSWYPDKKHGLFTYFFLKGLHEGVDGGRVTAGQIEEYLRQNVTRVARRRGIPQTPEFKGKTDFVLLERD